MRLIRQSLRTLRRNPAVSSIAVVSLVLAITLNAVIYSVVDYIWLQPAPYDEPDEIVHLFAGTERAPMDALSWPDYLDLRAGMETVSDMAAVQHRGASLFSEDYSVMLFADVVSRNFFTVLGVEAHLGDVFAETDSELLQAEPMVILSHSLWQRQFGGDPDIVGQTVMITNRQRTVMGIAPPGFYGMRRLTPIDLWFPEETWGYPEERSSRRFRDFYPVARLAPGETAASAQAEAEALYRGLELVDFASNEDQHAMVVTDRQLQNRSWSTMGIMLLAIVGAFLMISCANVSGLLLARSLGRQREMAIRLAVGGNRGHLIRQLLTEGLVLAGIAGVLSLVATSWLLGLLPTIMPPMPVYIEWNFALDSRTIIFALALALFTALLTTLLPALKASRPNLVPVLKSGQGAGTRREGRLGSLNLLVVGQLALSFVLIAVTGLLTRSFLQVQSLDLGFGNDNLLVAEVYPEGGREEATGFCLDLLDRVRAIPGVRHATIARHVPFNPSGGGATRQVFVPEAGPGWEEASRAIKFNLVEPDYFATLDIPLLRGRKFGDTDTGGSTPVMIVNETMAQRYWPDADPLGRRVILNSADGPAVEVVGVVPDGIYNSIGEDPEPYFYLPFGQLSWWDYLLVVDAGADPYAVMEPVHGEMRAMSSSLDIFPMTTLHQLVRDNTYERELTMWLVLFLAGLGVALAGVGLYGVISYAVTRRTHEMGVRQALGANRRDIVRLIVRHGGWLCLGGLAIGIPVAVAAGGLMQGLLFGVRPVDPMSLVLAFIVLAAIVLLATVLPGRRAAAVDPLNAIRYE